MRMSLRRASAAALGSLLLVALALLAAAALLGAAALQHEPTVPPPGEIDPQDLARATRLLRLHDPRRAVAGRVRAVALGEHELEALFDHGAGRWVAAASRVRITSGAATVTVSAPLQAGPLQRWLNVEARLVQTGGLPAIVSLRVGRLPVPPWLGERFALALVDRAGLLAEWRLGAEVVRRVQFAPRQLQLVYAWSDDSTQRLFETLLPPAERQRLRAYADRVAEWSQGRAPAWEAPMSALLGPVFAIAQQRSTGGGDAAAENRAAIVVLALYANGRGVASLLPDARAWPQPRPLRLLLGGRDDFPRHFLVSAALVVETTGALARSIGLAKEVADARGGSGFSFNDMAANRAGTAFGEAALRMPAQLQARLARGVDDDALMPPWRDLPEFMPEAEFVRRYGGVGAPGYVALMAEIERRVGALALFR